MRAHVSTNIHDTISIALGNATIISVQHYRSTANSHSVLHRLPLNNDVIMGAAYLHSAIVGIDISLHLNIGHGPNRTSYSLGHTLLVHKAALIVDAFAIVQALNLDSARVAGSGINRAKASIRRLVDGINILIKISHTCACNNAIIID